MINIFDEKTLQNTIKMGIQQCANLIVEEKDEKIGFELSVDQIVKQKEKKWI